MIGGYNWTGEIFNGNTQRIDTERRILSALRPSVITLGTESIISVKISIRIKKEDII